MNIAIYKVFEWSKTKFKGFRVLENLKSNLRTSKDLTNPAFISEP